MFVIGAAAHAAVFPKPREIQLSDPSLALSESVPILLPERATAEDGFLARFLLAEMSERHGLALRLERVRSLPVKGPFVLMGTMRNSLVAAYAGRHGLTSTAPEGYALEVNAGAAVVVGSDDAGAFYGLQTLRQMVRGSSIQGARVRDWPLKPFRGIKLYLPGRENIGYFKRFVRDFMALYKLNTVIVELNAAMRFDRHPELNAGWIEFGKDMNHTRRERSWGPGRQFQDSANADTADFGVLEKEEVADLVRYARQHYIEVIPEVPALTHSYYLLTRHRELAEVPDAEWPDTYCPSEPKVYPLLFDVLDEYVEVMKPRMVHVGHDEWRMPLGVCRRCQGKDPTELFAGDLNKIYAHLRGKGVRTAIWADHLIQPLRGVKVQKVRNPKGTPYVTPGALSPEQVKAGIPKDILMFNWFWDTRSEEGLSSGQGEPNEVALQGWGFEQVFGNLRPDFADWDRRVALPGVRRNLSATPYPSDDGAITPVDIAAALNTDVPGLKDGRGRAAGPNAPPIAVGADVSSLVFLHASSRAGRNAYAYSGAWNFADTAELLGWYEVVYDDGLRISVPVRYGVNILEASKARSSPKALAYYAEAVDSGQVNFYAYEWINPRFGKPVRQVLLHASRPDNAILLAALGAVHKRVPPEPKALKLVGEPFQPRD
jgi:hexosaminidase